MNDLLHAGRHGSLILLPGNNSVSRHTRFRERGVPEKLDLNAGGRPMIAGPRPAAIAVVRGDTPPDGRVVGPRPEHEESARSRIGDASLNMKGGVPDCTNATTHSGFECGSKLCFLRSSVSSNPRRSRHVRNSNG